MNSPKDEPRVVRQFARCLNLGTIFADFKISFNAAREIVVTINGCEEMRRVVEVTLSGDTIFIAGKLPGVEVDEYQVNVSHSNKTWIVNGVKLDEAKKLDISISLPWTAEIELGQYALGSMNFKNNGGSLTLRSTSMMSIQGMSFANLKVEVGGMGSLNVGKVTGNSYIDLAGHGGFYADSLFGTLSLKITSMGGFEAERVAVTSADVEIEGHGGVSINSLSGTLTAHMTGMGGINVDEVQLKTAKIFMSGHGGVVFDGGTVNNLSVYDSSMGSFEHDGLADVGSFEVHGMGGIKVNRCLKVIKNIRTGMGRIEIG